MSTGLGQLLLLPPADMPLVLELERIHRLEAAGQLGPAEATWLAGRAHDALDAELERREAPRTRFDCRVCGAIGSRPTHRIDCIYYRRRPR